MRITNFIVLTIIVAALLGTGCARKPRGTIADRAYLDKFEPLPRVISGKGGLDDSAPLVSLGQMLYFDTRLSKSQTISCDSCHPLSTYGADRAATSIGYRGQHGKRNSPTVYNAAAQFAQFWDGRANTLEEQAKGPLLNPVEMAMPSPKAVTSVLTSMPGYVAAFRRAFPGDPKPVTFDHAAEAIAAFERRLLTPSRWDQFLHGEEAALTFDEKEGFNVFMQEGCSSCHSGPLVGGDAYQRLGALKPYPDTSDPGRFKVTKNESDRMIFKVPSLRNVVMTGPYFHNGQVGTLNDAVGQMAEYQLGKKLRQNQVHAIVTWLGVLTGDLPASYTKPPELPKSTSRTPKPLVSD
jgi:cytochrome c peroxidase